MVGVCWSKLHHQYCNPFSLLVRSHVKHPHSDLVLVAYTWVVGADLLLVLALKAVCWWMATQEVEVS